MTLQREAEINGEAKIEAHNQRQRTYFERARKRTMEPAQTPYIRRQVEQMLQFAGIEPGHNILEVGCGMGRYTLALAARSMHIEGLDLSPVLLKHLREYDGGRYNVPLHCADILRPPQALEGRFDALLGFFALHHLHDLDACFKAMVRLVRPGGSVTFLEPNPYCALYYLQMLITPGMTWQGDGGLTRMRTGVLFRAMQQAGLRQLKKTRFGFFPPALANRPWGGPLEDALERFPPWRPFLPFQVFSGRLPVRAVS